MTGTLEVHIKHMYAMRLGLNIEDPPVYMSVLSAVDPTVASGGGDVLYLHCNVPQRPDGGWASAKDGYTAQIWKSALRFLGGVET